MDLLRRLRNKDEVALKQLMEQYGTYLVRTVYLTVKDRQLAEEIVQDTFVQAFKKIDQLHDETKLKSWLTTIAINYCRSTLRKKKLKLLYMEEDWQFEDHHVMTPEQYLLEISTSNHLSDAIMSLDYKYREVVTLYYFNEYSIDEIAEITESKSGTIKSRLLRARKQLSERLVQEGK